MTSSPPGRREPPSLSESPSTPPRTSSASSFLMAGQRLSDYVNVDVAVDRVIVGGFGLVAIGRDHLNNGATCVLKTYHPARAEHAPHLRDLFIREALTWIRVWPHPNLLWASTLVLIDIPPVAQRHPFLNLSYAASGDLRRRLVSLPHELATALDWSQQLAAGVLALHTPDPELERGIIIHRDLSPGNVLFHHGRLLITDLGLAKAFEQASLAPDNARNAVGDADVGNQVTAPTAARSLLAGTPGYIAPERLRGEEATPAVDIYALGVLLRQICRQVEYMPEALTTLLVACCAEQPGTRPSAAEVLAALQSIAQAQRLTPYEPPTTARTPAALANVWGNWGNAATHVGQAAVGLSANDRALALNPDNATTWKNRGGMLSDLGRDTEVLAAYEHAIALDPQYADAWKDRGNTLWRLGRYEEALAANDQAVVLNSDRPKAWVDRGAILGKLGRYEEAVAAMDRALALNPQYAKAWSDRGAMLGQLGRDEEALAAVDQALALDSENADTWNNRGAALGRLGRHEEAVTAFDRALALEPHGAHSAGFAFNLGLALGYLERWEEAIAVYEQTVAQDPAHKFAWHNRGNALWRLGRYEEALVAQDRALALDPQYTKAWVDRGATLAKLGRWDEALTAFDCALACDPENQAARSNKAVALPHLGREQET